MVEILIKAMSIVSEALIRHSALLKASQGCGYKSLNEQHSEENQVLANYSFDSSQSIIVSVFSTKMMLCVGISFQGHCVKVAQNSQ